MAAVLDAELDEEGTRAQMHENEVHTDEDRVRRLLRAQFPDWANPPLVELFCHTLREILNDAGRA